MNPRSNRDSFTASQISLRCSPVQPLRSDQLSPVANPSSSLPAQASTALTLVPFPTQDAGCLQLAFCARCEDSRFCIHIAPPQNAACPRRQNHLPELPHKRAVTPNATTQ